MVRHPFERLASAFQDKVILLPCLEMVSVIKIYNVKGRGAGKKDKNLIRSRGGAPVGVKC